ncbi:MAG: hypothetical protein ACE5E5_04945 [Phycisphaerae bacterium]
MDSTASVVSKGQVAGSSSGYPTGGSPSVRFCEANTAAILDEAVIPGKTNALDGQDN